MMKNKFETAEKGTYCIKGDIHDTVKKKNMR